MRYRGRRQLVPPRPQQLFHLHRQRQGDARQPAAHLQKPLAMDDIFTLILCLAPIVGVFALVMVNKRAYEVADAILNRLFDQFD